MRYWIKSFSFGGGLPILFLVLVLLCFFVFRKRRLGTTLAILGLFICSLYVFPGNVGLIAGFLRTKAGQLDHPNCLTDPLCQTQAIVVPSCGINKHGFLSEASWWRTRKGVELWKANKAPLLVFTGGRPGPDYPLTEAQTMANEAKQLGVSSEQILLENMANHTRDNATLTFSLLKPLGITKIILVTSRLHLPRANATFRKAGFETIPIAADPDPKKEFSTLLYPPSWENAANLEAVLNEYLGIAYYRLMEWL